MMDKEVIDYIDVYNNFWKEIVENEDGTLNKDQVMRELSDYSMVLDNCAKAYYAMTDGIISKQNTKFFEVENIFNQNYTRTEYYDELEEENKQLKDNWNKLKEYLKVEQEISISFQEQMGNYAIVKPQLYIETMLNKMQELESGDSDE